MAQRLRGRATSVAAAGLAAVCLVLTAGPALADTVRDQEWWLTSLNVTKAWLSSRGSGITVAVLDTGVNPQQPDLAGSVITGPDFTGSGRTSAGPFWGIHGTAVASLIAGHGHGPHHGEGIIGVAPAAKILSVRATLENNDPGLATTAAALPQAIARGIGYAVRHGAQVIDLPLDPAAEAGSGTTGGSPQERAAVTAALAKGVVLVAPAGDDGTGADTVNYPAAYPGVISVGAFNQTFTRAPYSSERPYVTLTAAGDSVIAASGNGYAKIHSTSAASALVAGMAALIRSQFPQFTPAQVSQALTSSTVFHPQGGQQDGSGAGTADAAAALVAAARINASRPASQQSGAPVNPTPPAPPKVNVHIPSLWATVRYPALGLIAILLLAVVVLIVVRTRQRRALNAQLAPLRAAAEASRAPSVTAPPGAAVDPSVPASPAGPRRSPFDDAAFALAAFPERAFGDPAPGTAALANPILPNPVFGDPGTGGDSFRSPAAARTGSPFDDPEFGTPGAGLPTADAAAFGGAGSGAGPFGPPAGAAAAGTPGGAAADVSPLGGSPFGRPAASEPSATPLRTLGSTHRLSNVRAPKTTGHPPWEPAEKPAGELPWMDAPARGAAGRLVPPRLPGPAGGGASGDTRADGGAGRGDPSNDSPRNGEASTGEASTGDGDPESAWPARSPSGLPVRRPTAGRGPFPGLEPPSVPGSGSSASLFEPPGQETPARRVFAWNPGETTEAFPAVPPEDNQQN